MGLFDKLFGGKKKEAPPAPPVRRAPREEGERQFAADPRATVNAPIEEMNVKELTRQLGTGNVTLRLAVEERLGALGDRSTLRPLMNTYLMHGDPPALEALRQFGGDLTGPAKTLADDVSNVNERRARIMDILGYSGDEDALPIVRVNLDDYDPLVRSRAAAALTRLGDMNGIDRLDRDLQTNDPLARKLALHTLHEFEHIPKAAESIQDHLDRFLADANAVPARVVVTAPRILEPETSLSKYIVQQIQSRPHTLSIVVGHDAHNWATARRGVFEEGLPGVEVRFPTPRMVPEEQVAELEAARNAAAAGKQAAVIGMLPSPSDDPPLPNLLVPVEGGKPYSIQLFIVDPHEFNQCQAWWFYLQDRVDLPNDIEVVLGISKPGSSAISEEEYELYNLLKDPEKRGQFTRALLARI
ncbi:MAG: HEAT repeat domain-containing protein [Anaerolineae bacterium]